MSKSLPRLREYDSISSEEIAARIKECERTIYSAARRFFRPGCGIEFSEALSAGEEGVLKAMTLFDPGRGVKFSSYAKHWVNKYVRKCVLLGAGKGKSGSAEAAKGDYERTKNDLQKQLERSATRSEIAAAMGITIKRLDRILLRAQSEISLSAPQFADGERERVSLLPDENADDPVEVLELKEIRLQVQEAISRIYAKEKVENDKKLSREAQMLDRAFGLSGQEPVDYKILAEEFKVSKQRIHQIRNDAFKRLRKDSAIQLLLSDPAVSAILS